MQTDGLRDYLKANWQTLRADISEGNYRPQAVRKVEIEKPQGGKQSYPDKPPYAERHVRWCGGPVRELIPHFLPDLNIIPDNNNFKP